MTNETSLYAAHPLLGGAVLGLTLACLVVPIITAALRHQWGAVMGWAGAAAVAVIFVVLPLKSFMYFI